MTATETVELPVLAQWSDVYSQSEDVYLLSSQAPAEFRRVPPDSSNKAKEQWLEEGNSHYKANRFTEALIAFEEALRLDPNDATAYNGKGKALRRLNRYEEALVTFEQAIRLNPHYPKAYCGKGDSLSDGFNRYEEALAAYEQAIRLDSHCADAYLGKGEQLRLLRPPSGSTCCLCAGRCCI
jgi:tetratricopeptide (TPR) repeat protein